MYQKKILLYVREKYKRCFSFGPTVAILLYSYLKPKVWHILMWLFWESEASTLYSEIKLLTLTKEPYFP